MIVRMDGTYQTRDGRGVRILCTDLKGPGYLTTLGLIMNPDGNEEIETWLADGSVLATGEASDSDLVPVPREHQGWMVMSANGCPEAIRIYPSREEAELAASMVPGGRAIPITWLD